MKRKSLSLAVTAALLGGAASVNGAMHVNDRGLGEALIYPFFSAANGNDTYVHVVNTTDYVKAVKVRFIEARNSQEVLDFNLYLSPDDEWAAAITANPEGEGALVRTIDNSCTVPALGTPNGGGEFDGYIVEEADGDMQRNQPFVNFRYDVAGEADRGLGRTLEGYVEIIEMGQLDPEVGTKGPAAVHDESGVPANCDLLVAAWSSQQTGNLVTQGDWINNPFDELLTWTGGGLYGYGVLINVEQGTALGMDAIAIDDFVDENALIQPLLHFQPGDDDPSWGQAQQTSTIFLNGLANDYTFLNGFDSVSSLLQTTELANDYVIDPEINALTDWVITMPTKKEYVIPTVPLTDPAPTAQPVAADAPFANRWNGATACEPVAIGEWDREEAFVPPPSIVTGPGFSPRPPVIIEEVEDFIICTEVSVISFGADSAVNATGDIRYGFEPEEHTEGWAELSFDPADLNDPSALPVGARELVDAGGSNAFFGLPAVGFAAFNYQNGTLGGGTVLANYAAASEHKSRASVGRPGTSAP